MIELLFRQKTTSGARMIELLFCKGLTADFGGKLSPSDNITRS
jgi:hypothetical protein